MVIPFYVSRFGAAATILTQTLQGLNMLIDADESQLVMVDLLTLMIKEESI